MPCCRPKGNQGNGCDTKEGSASAPQILLFRLQHPAHDDAVAGEGADEGVITGGGEGEFEGFLFAHVQQLGVVQHVVTGGDEAFFEAGGAHDDGGVHDGVGFAGLGDEEVVGHHVGVGEGELDLLTGLHVELLHVIHEALADGGDADGGQFGRVAEDAGFLGLLFGFSGDDAAFGAGFDVEPELLHDVGGVASVEFGAGLQFGEQRGVVDVVLLVEPESFEKVMRVFFLGGVELFHPFLRGGDDFSGGALAEFDTSAMAHAIGGMPQVFEQCGDGLAVDGDGLLQLAAFGGHAVNAAVFVVAVRIADVVLHVADDDVVPVGDVKGAVFAEDGITGAEVFVATHD